MDDTDLAPAAPTETVDRGTEDVTRPWRERMSALASTTDGTAATDRLGLVDPVDRVAAFGPAILAIRWGTTIASLALAVERYDDRPAVAIWAAVILVYTILRTIQPIRYMGTLRSLIEVIFEVALGVAAVCTTGAWDSPFIFSLMPAKSTRPPP